MPDLNGTNLTATVAQWKEFWILPCLMAAAIMVIFAVAFWPAKITDEQQA
jgi:hypothetical protein